ncbi:MAG: epimerase [Bacteroidota bacterium]|nr:epimerase [Bacteroidota bacterium]
MKVILFGSTGMIGQGVLIECLKDPLVESVLVVNRQTCGVIHAKLKEIIHLNFFDLAPISKELAGYNVCFYCLGVSSAGMKEEEYNTMTYELTTHVATVLLNQNKELTFCYISGAGSDSTEKGNIMWARIKGKTENRLLRMPFKDAYMFRPGYIQPMGGIKSKTGLYNAAYTILKPFYFLIKHIESMVTNTETLGKAMIIAASTGVGKKVLESSDINEIVNTH